MPTINKNWGVLERWWAIQWATLKAEAYIMFHPSCRVYIENTWVEDRGTRNEHHENEFVENIHYVAVVKGTILKGNLEVVKEYYGHARYPLEQFNVNAQKE